MANTKKPHAREVNVTTGSATVRRGGRAPIDGAVGASPGTIQEKPAGYGTNQMNGRTEPFYKPGWHNAGIVQSGMAGKKPDAQRSSADKRVNDMKNMLDQERQRRIKKR